ncbi:hypothetical protein AWRI1631_73840 [Saccharomyces cerevisiae AWRI1631]|uniref:Uncharacterized protein n=1 Tax=Saccharomyces cerevisiae (strain AWRI1631) TaxID=545124 RepID=B5VJA6_YEAS6|nr:hypothetical protein AWRI1631_73840 [Saccharomyces cerevisiae AWRI1631]
MALLVSSCTGTSLFSFPSVFSSRSFCCFFNFKRSAKVNTFGVDSSFIWPFSPCSPSSAGVSCLTSGSADFSSAGLVFSVTSGLSDPFSSTFSGVVFIGILLLPLEPSSCSFLFFSKAALRSLTCSMKFLLVFSASDIFSSELALESLVEGVGVGVEVEVESEVSFNFDSGCGDTVDLS